MTTEELREKFRQIHPDWQTSDRTEKRWHYFQKYYKMGWEDGCNSAKLKGLEDRYDLYSTFDREEFLTEEEADDIINKPENLQDFI